MKIKEVKARIILDSRKEKTIEVSINNCKTSAPAGKSKGKYEAPSYKTCIEDDFLFINNLKLSLEIKEFEDLSKVEEKIKNKIGANTLFALEASILKALAKENKVELWQLLNPKAQKFPRILSNTIGGGAHSEGIKPDFQEFLIVCDKNPAEGKEQNLKSYYEAGEILENLGKKGGKNDENAWQTSLGNEQTLEVMKDVQENIFDESVVHMDIGIDVASSQFYKNGKYSYENEKKTRTRQEQIDYVAELANKFNIAYMEDPLDEEDFESFAELRKKTKCMIVGDDLTVTNLERLKKAIKTKAISGMIIKPNQTGSLIEVKEVIELCKKNKIFTIMSHRSGETLDSTIADLAFAWGCDFIKTPVIGKERVVKVDRLVDIEKSLK
jgi:enolase